MGSDLNYQLNWAQLTDFNPRSPCGERLDSGYINWPDYQFQSTLPVWGATFAVGASAKVDQFQSTLPVWGATRQVAPGGRSEPFQSTLPVWGATGAIVPPLFL